MPDTRTQQLGTILDIMAEELDIPDAIYADIVAKYEHLGAWIKADSEAKFHTDSEIYPQGSIRLGTIIRPVKNGDEYDIDLVYRRELTKTGVTQEELKNQVGEQLKRYLEQLKREGKEVPDLEPGRRCWTLNFKRQFHMDVLPAIPDDEAAAHNIRDVEDGILITDRELREWHPSNPKGYANWFGEQQKVILREQRYIMANFAKVDVEQIPEAQVKTPLRRVVQALKRHRDLRYIGNPDDKPISIIITTLATKAYKSQPDFHNALIEIASGMRTGIEKRNGEYWVANPVNPEENYADKWKQEPERPKRFFEWLGQVEADIAKAQQQTGLQRLAESLEPVFGKEIVAKSMERYGQQMDATHRSGALRMAEKTGVLGAVGAAVKGNTWYGKE